MTEAERLANWLDSLDYHHNDRVKNYQEAAALIRSQDEELERLRGALGEIRTILNRKSDRQLKFRIGYAQQIVEEARAALGER